VETAGASLDTLNALDTAILSTKRILEHGGASSSTDALVVSSCAMIGLAERLRQAEEKASNLRREVRVAAEAATVDLLEEGLVQSSVVESSAHIQEQQQSCVEPPPSATLASAIASSENVTIALYVWQLRRARCCFHAITRSCVRSARRRFCHRAVRRIAPCVEQGLRILFTFDECDRSIIGTNSSIRPCLESLFDINN
jgi:hypothetical protein